MDGCKNLYKQIDGLNVKIKKLESVVNKTVKNNNKDELGLKNNNKNLKHIQQNSNQNNQINKIESYQIAYPNNSGTKMSKKYIALMFNSIANSFDSDDNNLSNSYNPFIKLNGHNIIINYSIQFDLEFSSLESIICSLALGVKTKTDSKIKIIRGTKHFFDLACSNTIGSKLIISNTVLYSSEPNEDLCMIVDIGKKCFVNRKKSILKILTL